MPHTSHSKTCTASPIINISHQSDTFVAINKPTLTYHYHSMFIVYIRIHYWRGSWYIF